MPSKQVVLPKRRPWISKPQLGFLNRIVKKEWEVFEFGSGNSTLWWSSKVKHVTSVEDNQDWYAEIAKQMSSNVRLINKQDAAYWQSITSTPKNSLDLVIVDGSHRNECLESSLPYLKQDGIIFFDNSDEKKNVPSSNFLKANKFYRVDFFGTIPSYLYKNCTSEYFRDPKFLLEYEPPCGHQSDVGISCFQAMNQRT